MNIEKLTKLAHLVARRKTSDREKWDDLQMVGVHHIIKHERKIGRPVEERLWFHFMWNAMTDYLRSESRHHRAFPIETTTAALNATTDGGILAAEARIQFEILSKSMKPDDMTLFSCVADGMKKGEVAKALNVPGSTVGTRLMRKRRKAQLLLAS